MKTRLLAIGILISLSVNAQSIERVEPANWWTGMKTRNLQLLVYGKSISDLKPVIESETISLERVIQTQNTNYLFLNIRIKKGAIAGNSPIRFYKGRNLVYTHNFELVQRQRKAEDIIGFNTSDVMYLITPDRFANGNPDNDNVDGMLDPLDRSDKGGRHGGDIKGMVDHLDYIRDMGFTAIWINPIIENNMPKYSYHGYAATDFYKIDPRYGSNEEYRQFCQLAKEKGIKVIMDMIMNHSGSEHWFVKDPPTSDWVNNQDKWTQTSHRRNVNQDIHASNYDKKAFSDGWFVKTMPDLNQRNELMATYLIQNTIWWVEYSGISGIRMDTYPYPDKYFMSNWTCAVINEYPNINIVGEEWSYNPAIVSYWQKGKVNHDGYTSCLPSLMDFPLQLAVSEALTDEEKQYGTGSIKMYEALSMDMLYPDPDNLVVFPDNHDMDRFYTQVKGDYRLYKMGMIFFATVRGVPEFYYGTEVLMQNDDFPNDHGMIRSDFPGGWAGDESNAFTGAGLTAIQKEAQGFTRKLLNWRKTSKAVHEGKLIHFAPVDGLYVFARITAEATVVVLFNKHEEARTVDFEIYSELLKNQAYARDVLTGEDNKLSSGIMLDGLSAVILELH